MSKFNMDSVLGDVLKDERAIKILSDSIPTAFNHPRFSEALTFTLREIVNDDMGAIVGLPKSFVKKIVKEIISFE